VVRLVGEVNAVELFPASGAQVQATEPATGSEDHASVREALDRSEVDHRLESRGDVELGDMGLHRDLTTEDTWAPAQALQVSDLVHLGHGA
jgi:hypothetical protein